MGRKILLVEDDRETAAYLTKGLGQEGHSVELATNGQDGLFRATDGSFDLIVLDRMLPVLDGISVLKALRAAQIDTPVLVLSALASVGDRIEGLESGSDDYLTKPFSFAELLARVNAQLRARKPVPRTRFELADLFYSLGIHNPGAIRLHNYPKFLQNLVQDNGERFDIGTIDILRDRERGVPRYNRFRRLLGRSPVKSFEDLTDVPEWAAEMKRVYNNDLEMVDTMVGMMAEPLPEGMGFSDTAFRIFLLMASRRLKSDRFLSQDYRPEIYTKEGIDWVEENSMKSVISRHFPSVAFAMEGLDDDNAFKPWKPKKA